MTVGYEDGGRVRPVVYRATVSEMVVHCGHPGPDARLEDAFDAGEWGLGAGQLPDARLRLLGEIRYSTTSSPTSAASRTRGQRHLIHEEDFGIISKHLDMVSGAPRCGGRVAS